MGEAVKGGWPIAPKLEQKCPVLVGNLRVLLEWKPVLEIKKNETAFTLE